MFNLANNAQTDILGAHFVFHIKLYHLYSTYLLFTYSQADLRSNTHYLLVPNTNSLCLFDCEFDITDSLTNIVKQ